MTKKLNNIEIEALKNMQKSLTKPLRVKWTTSLKFKQITIDLCNIDRTMMFKLYMRQSVLDEDNFSCGISFTKNGEDDITLVVVRSNSDATFKKLVIESDERKYLQALNPNFQPNIIEFEEGMELVGLVIDAFRPLGGSRPKRVRKS